MTSAKPIDKLKQIDNLINYWKNFNRNQLKENIEECLSEILNVKTQIEKVEKLIEQLKESRDIGIDRTEEVLSVIQYELNNLIQNTDDNEYPSTFVNIEQKLRHIGKAIDNLEDPSTALESVSNVKKNYDEALDKLTCENKQLKDMNLEFSLHENRKSDTQLIQHLSGKLSRTLASNTNLSQQLKTAQLEIDSLKKLVLAYRNETNNPQNTLQTIINGYTNGNHLNNNNDDHMNGDDMYEYDMNGNDDDEDEDAVQDDTQVYNMSNGMKRKISSDDFDDTNSSNQMQNNTQSSFYNYSNTTITNIPDYIDTHDLINRLKEFMAKFKISQQEMGRRIVGCKKSHAGFLITNIRPWNELTRKGKEPYIKIYHFLEDEDNFKKFFNGTYQIPNVDSSLIPNETPNKPRLTKNSRMSLPPNSFHTSQIDTKPILTAALSQSFNYTQDELYEEKYDPSKIETIPYDISNIPENKEFDTNALVEELKDTLRSMKISQELFCKAVLNVSDRLLSRPRPWSGLGKRGREHFLRIYMFLQDPFRGEKIKEWSTKNDFNRIRRKRIRTTNVNDSALQEFDEFNQKLADNGSSGIGTINDQAYDYEIGDCEEFNDQD